MKSKIILVILAVGLLVGGTAASFAENLKKGIYRYADLKITVQIHTPAVINGDTLRVKLMNKAAQYNVPTKGRTLREIAGDVKKIIQAKHESVLKYRTIIQSFSGAFVQYPQRSLPGSWHLVSVF
ncbi:MAG: hypothetical protein ACOY4I_13935 [Bacillota bacterium]